MRSPAEPGPWYGAFSSAGVLPWWLTAGAVVVTLVLGLLLTLLIRWLDTYRGNQAVLLVGASLLRCQLQLTNDLEVEAG